MDSITSAELQAVGKQLLEAGGLFAVQPMQVRGIAYERVFLASNLSLRDFLSMAMMKVADREFIVHGDMRMTIAETWAASAQIADVLMREHDIGPGKRVAIAMRNYPEWIIAYFGIIATGATVVPLNAWWKSEELQYSLEDSGTQIVFCDEKRMGLLEPIKEALGLKTILVRSKASGADDYWDKCIGRAKTSDMPKTPVDPDSDFCILYTSGSTGKPKGVMLTHRGAISALLSWAFLSEVIKTLRPETNFIPDDPKILMVLPLFHVTASHSLVLLSFIMGRTMVMMDRWEADKALSLIKKEKITNFTGVPTMTHELVALAKPGELDSMVDITTGGAKRPEQHVAEQFDKFPKIVPGSGYGLTETNALGSHIALIDYVKRPGSACRVIPPLSEFAIWGEDDKPLPIGEVGEVVIKSPANFRGYLNMPEETARSLTEDGWFRTGDLGKFDEEGFLYIVDRVKDLIIRGGENISCLEVENAIYKFPGIAEVSVFAVPDDRLNEIVGAAIFPKQGVDLDLTALIEFLREGLAGFKVPERIWVSPQKLLRGGTGKIDKRAVRDIALQFPAQYSA